MKPYKLAVKAVILNGSGKCLLLRRSNANRRFAGCWEWPGGKVDPGEDFTAALVRETREETGLDVEITGFAGAATFEMPAVNVVLLCMEAGIKAGEIRLSEEHDAWEWASLNEVGSFNLIDGLKKFMLEYAKRKT